ncbi:VOC family protein [Candidatus Microgenomates bacterium]|nr:VOC family protein [Candidatus Microgenomates bacterium]
MKLNAVEVCTSNMAATLKFYELLGFEFPQLRGDEQHVDSLVNQGSVRLMIDKKEVAKEIIGSFPIPSNYSSFCIEYDSPEEVNKIVGKVKMLGFMVVKEPWDAFWGQRYAIIEDPDGYKIDLYAALKSSL